MWGALMGLVFGCNLPPLLCWWLFSRLYPWHPHFTTHTIFLSHTLSHCYTVTPPPSSGEKQVEISELPDWAQPAFKGMKALNRVQSKVSDCALYSSENMLVCAPTGERKQWGPAQEGSRGASFVDDTKLILLWCWPWKPSASPANQGVAQSSTAIVLCVSISPPFRDTRVCIFDDVACCIAY